MMKPINMVLHLLGQLEESSKVFGTLETRITAEEGLHRGTNGDRKLLEVDQVNFFRIKFDKPVLRRIILSGFE